MLQLIHAGSKECHAPSSHAYTSVHSVASGVQAATPKWKQVLFHDKPKPRLVEPNKLVWPVKRDKLNKCIYKHKMKLLTCKVNLELVSDYDSGPIPKLSLQLHPYGTEEDGNKCITAKVSIELPKKCRLHSDTRIEFQISAREDDTSSGREMKRWKEQITQKFFYVKEFITYQDLKNSQHKYVQVCAIAKFV